MVLLKELPALVVLERFPVPVLAIAEDGTILFANEAFGEMLGHPADAVTALKFRQIFHALPADESLGDLDDVEVSDDKEAEEEVEAEVGPLGDKDLVDLELED